MLIKTITKPKTRPRIAPQPEPEHYPAPRICPAQTKTITGE